MKIINFLFLCYFTKIFILVESKINLEESKTETNNKEEVSSLRRGKSKNTMLQGGNNINPQMTAIQNQQMIPNMNYNNPQTIGQNYSPIPQNMPTSTGTQMNPLNGIKTNNKNRKLNNGQIAANNSTSTNKINNNAAPQQFQGFPQKPALNLVKSDQGSDEEYEEIIQEITTSVKGAPINNANPSGYQNMPPQNVQTMPQQQMKNNNQTAANGQAKDVQTTTLNNQGQQAGLQNSQQIQQTGQPQQNAQAISQQQMQMAQVPGQNGFQPQIAQNLPQQQIPNGMLAPNRIPQIGFQSNLPLQGQGAIPSPQIGINNFDVYFDNPNNNKKNMRNVMNNKNSGSMLALVNIIPLASPNNKNNKQNSQSSCCDVNKTRKCMKKCEFRGGMDQCMTNIEISYVSKYGEQKARHLEEACVCKESKHKYNVLNYDVSKRR